jgi:hypothetical protein
MSNMRVAYLLSRSIDDGVLVSIFEFLDGINVSNDAFGANQAGRDSAQGRLVNYFVTTALNLR